MNKVILILLLLFSCFSFGQRYNERTLKNQISLQKNYTCGDVKEENEYVFVKKDLDLLLPLVDEMLQSNGYIKPDYLTFKETILKKFHVNIDEISDIIYIINRNNFIQFKGNLGENLYDECSSNLFIDKKKMFIIPMIFLTDVYDQKQKKAKQNLKILLLNKYLFNNDKSGVAYLVNSESKFMYDMLVSFRFDGIDKSNRQSIDLFYENNEKYKIGDVIFSKTKIGNLIICVNLLDTFDALFNETKNVETILPLKFYSSRIIDKKEETHFNNADKMKILAYLANLYDPLFKKYHNDGQNWGDVSILADYKDYVDKEEWEKIKQEYKNNNYYNLPNLKAMIEYAELFDSAGVPN